MRALMKRFMRILSIVAATVCSVPVHAAWHFTAIDFPDAAESNVFGVNDSGQAVGYAFDVTPDLFHPFGFLYDIKKGTYTRLPRAFGEEFGTFAVGINNQGTVVGTFLNELGQPAFIRNKKGQYTAFTRPGLNFIGFRGVNERGLVVGSAGDGSPQFGFTYDPASNTYVDFLPSLETVAHNINNRGDVAGSIYLDAAAACALCPEGFYGFVRTARGGVMYFRVNGLETRARGITDSGLVAGFVDLPSGEVKSFVTQLAGLPYEAITIPDASLLQFPGMPLTIAEGINNKGDVVGIYLDADFASHGFVARQSPH